MSEAAAALSVDRLAVTTTGRRGGVTLVDGATLAVPAGRALGLVGESGSGKSLTLRALMGTLPAGVAVAGGDATLLGAPLPLVAGRRVSGLSRSRRGRMAMIFQDPLTALDPVMTVGAQVAEAPRVVGGLSHAAARRRAIELLTLARVPDPEGRAAAYPHQLSGGLRQRVMIAVALSSDPKVLLCDEPTTALDVTIQAEILDLLRDLRARLDLTLVFVSHDLAVVGQVCDELAVMYAGRIVERGPTEDLLRRPRHPYTRGLLHATPGLSGPRVLPDPIPGTLPEPGQLPPGCSYYPRCPIGQADCTVAPVPLVAVDAGASGRAVACLHPDQVTP